MKKLLLLLLLLAPLNVSAAFAVPWTATSTTQGWVSPSAVNGVAQTAVANLFTALSTTGASVFPYASTTALSATALCLTSDCRTSWPTGTVTSVAMTAPPGLSVSGSPITTSGTLALTYASGYAGVLTASTTNWNAFYDLPSSRITAANGLTWNGLTLSVATSSLYSGTTGQVAYFDGTNSLVGTSSLFIATSGNVGIGTTPTDARLQLRGSGATSATKAFVVEDSAGTDLFAARDDGSIGLGKAAVSITSNSVFSVIAPHADYSGLTTITNNSGNGVTAAVSVFGGEVRYAGAAGREFALAIGGNFTIGSVNVATGNNIIAVRGTARLPAASGRATSLIGGDFLASSNDATGGTVTDAIGTRTKFSLDTAGVTVTNGYGLRVLDVVNAGTITNSFGVWVGDMTTGTQTNTPYSFYASDASALNYFAGRVGIGTAAPDSTTLLDIQQTGGAAGIARIMSISDTAANGAFLYLTHHRTGNASTTADEVLGQIYAGGIDTLPRNQRMISFEADGDWGTSGDSTDRPVRITFSTTNDGAAGPNERMRITGAGNVGIGTTTPLAELNVFAAATPELRVGWSTTSSFGQQSFFESGTRIGMLQGIGSAFATTDRRSDIELIADTGDISFWPGLAQTVTLKAGGNVGIGTTSPGTLTDIFSTATSTIRLDSNSATQGGCIVLKDTDGSGYTKVVAKDGVLTASITTTPTTCN